MPRLEDTVNLGPARDLKRRLREAGEAELYDLVNRRVDELDPRDAEQVLKNPHSSRRILELLAGARRVLSSYAVRQGIVTHPRAPLARSLNLVVGLYWKDLVKLGAESRAAPQVRRAADRRLAERLPSLALGERIAIARGGGAGAIARLRADPNLRVAAALLENPRLTETLLLPALADEATRPEILSLVANDRKWGCRYEIRLVIARNPATPPETALGLLSGLKKTDLSDFSADRRIDPTVRRRAELYCGKS